MSKITQLKEWYKREGPIALIKVGWVVLVYYTPLYPILERVFGMLTHEKMIRSPLLGYWPHIKYPTSFNEKVLHRKLLTDKDIYAKVADKWAVREYVGRKVGTGVLNTVYHVTDDPETIPFESLPDEFVIKANHGSGWNIIVEDKSEIDPEEIRAQCRKWLSTTYGARKREYWYREIEPKLTIERYLHDEEYGVPIDFKFFVFHGEVKIVEVDSDRFSGHKQRFYNTEWREVDFTRNYPKGPHIEEPKQLDEMIAIAEKIGEDFEFARVDLYNPNGETIVFGEITLAPQSGGGGFNPIKYDYKLGSYW